ncbi:MAG: hypothetical protein ACFHX7_13920 [Pseudomonadota bacterium]
MTPVRTKMLIVMLLPITLIGAVAIIGNFLAAASEVNSRAEHYGGAIADQLAQTITDQLVQEDVLGLNVLLADLLRNDDFAFASVYATDNRLLAQVGRNSDHLRSFSRDITFQDAALGSVTIGFNPGPSFSGLHTLLVTSLLLLALVIGVLAGAIFLYGDMIYLWFSIASNRPGTGATPDEPEAHDRQVAEVIPEPIGLLTILVIKIRPMRQLDSHRQRVLNALSLYRGDLLDEDGEDLVVAFEQADQVFRAICAGQLIRRLMNQVRGNIAVKQGMNSLAEPASERDRQRAIKQATYLASIASDQLLTSRTSREAVQDTHGIQLVAFHSSLAPEGEVFCLESLDASHEHLINQQANQLR